LSATRAEGERGARSDRAKPDIATTGRLTLTLLGGFEGRLDDSQPLILPARKAWALLAYLALPPPAGCIRA